MYCQCMKNVSNILNVWHSALYVQYTHLQFIYIWDQSTYSHWKV